MLILNEFPSDVEFYKTYWGRKPFVVRGGIGKDVFEDIIDGDMLAGLSMEDDVKSRLVVTAPEGNKWSCEHGPFEEERFSTLGEENWSLLVQNVEQYHTETADLLRYFNFSPRWLLDDIMVSYSAKGGTVGPHTDSYHVFLVQGIGRRIWRVGEAPVENEDCIDGLDLKVLKDGVKGDDIEATMGDVIYIPPHFAHEGKTLETAMTLSVGFLGPKMSELFIEYGHYLEGKETSDKRYSGQGLEAESAHFFISGETQKNVRGALIDSLNSDDFSVWLTEYFSTPTDADDGTRREDDLTEAELIEALKSGETLIRPEYIKLCITATPDGGLTLAVYGQSIPTNKEHNKLISWLGENNRFTFEDLQTLGSIDKLIEPVTYLYNHSALNFEE